MRWGTLLILLGLALQTGCLLARNTVHNLVNETVTRVDENSFSRRLRADARSAWQLYCRETGGEYSIDFADGFREGYVDYLESGGNGSPPAVPPLRYRRSEYLSPEGHARIREYFAGFKTGVDFAHASGHRDYMTVPVLVPDPPLQPPLPGMQIPTAPVRAGEQLPSPRKMDPMTGLPTPVRPLAEASPPLPGIPNNSTPDAASSRLLPAPRPAPTSGRPPLTENVLEPVPTGIPDIPAPATSIPVSQQSSPAPSPTAPPKPEVSPFRSKQVLEESLQSPDSLTPRRSILPEDLPAGRRILNDSR